MQGFSFRKVEKRVVTARQHGRHVVAVMFPVRTVNNADGAVPPRFKQKTVTGSCPAELQQAAPDAGTVQQLLPAPFTRCRYRHALRRSAPGAAGDDAARIRAEPDQYDASFLVLFPDELADVDHAGPGHVR